jgi:hypothetical protein
MKTRNAAPNRVYPFITEDIVDTLSVLIKDGDQGNDS